MDHKEIEKYRLELKSLDKEKSKDFKKIECPSCAAAIKSADLNIQDKVAKCSSCDVVFSFEKDLVELGRNEKPTQELIRPEGIELFHFHDELEISVKKPFTTLEQVIASTVPLVAFFASLAYISPKTNMPFYAFLMLIFIGLSPIVYLIARRNQKIYINIDKKYFSITKGAGQFQKDKYYEAQDIDQIYIKSANHKYNLMALVNTPQGQKHVKLITELTSISKAKYLEQEIERHLNIENRGVPEEYK